MQCSTIAIFWLYYLQHIKPISAHKVQNKVQQIHSISIEQKLPTTLKITSIDLENKISLHFFKFSTNQII